MKTATRHSYAARIERAQHYLLEHMDEAIDLERIAAVAHYSPYHFVTTTPGGHCAQLIHTGPYSELHDAYNWLYHEWLPKSGEEPGDLPPFEEYLNDPRDTPPAQLQTAIRIPLRGK